MANIEDIRKMVEEIEAGVYISKRDNIEVYNDSSEGSSARENGERITARNRRRHIDDQMPTYTKIEAIPSPDMKMFEDFEKFL